MTNNEMCQGCSTSSVLCERTPIIDDMVCPCVNCLVKTMCRIGCEEFQDYIYINIQESVIIEHLRSFCEGDI
jgi:hypothetical protein